MNTAITPKPPVGVTVKVADACRALVFEGLDLQQAAAKTGLTTRALRLALEKPGVLAYLRNWKFVTRPPALGFPRVGRTNIPLVCSNASLFPHRF